MGLDWAGDVGGCGTLVTFGLELVAKLGALLWFQTLYEYDLQTLKPQKVSGLPKINLNEIALAVGKKIQPLNAVYEKEKVK